ncbi:MAG: hypothetical protein ACI8XU_000661 [Kiritimatiellia bacterium]|jgi:hypothetical protein
MNNEEGARFINLLAFATSPNNKIKELKLNLLEPLKARQFSEKKLSNFTCDIQKSRISQRGLSVASFLRRIPLLALVSLLPVFASAQDPLVAGANINMVSGTGFPGGDPFLQRQNEPSLAVSTRNPLHLLGGANDYRSVDIPGFTDGKAVGDSWHGIYTSVNGGGNWVSTLLPGYPQSGDSSSPLFGYEAGADPVIRAGTNGLFYYSGIVFDRGEGGESATFISRFMDLNNDPRNPATFEGGPIRYIDTKVIACDAGNPDAGFVGCDPTTDPTDPPPVDIAGETAPKAARGFIDKPWIAVDIPRLGVSQTISLNVPRQDLGYETQIVECGPLYSAYAQITGEDSADIDSHIMFSASYDCGESFSDPIELDNSERGVAERTINQGTTVAIDPASGDVYVAWRQFNSVTLSCTRGSDFWERNPEAWPVDRFMLGGVLYEKSQALDILAGSQNGNPWRLSRELITAKLNIFAGANALDLIEKIEEADAWLIDAEWVFEGSGNGTKSNNGKDNGKDNGNGKSDEKEKTNSSEASELLVFFENYNNGVEGFGPGNCDDFDIANGEIPGESNPDAIMLVRSSDFGATFSEPVMVSELVPFDQGTTLFSFRSNSYPTMTVDNYGRVYIAWSTRKLPGELEEFSDSRVVVSTSDDGASWTVPTPIDPRPIDTNQASQERGHQIQPTITFNRGKLLLVYLDFRQDRSGVFERAIADYFVPDPDPDPNADATEVPQYRHSVDVRAVQAFPDEVPSFSAGASVLKSTQLSRYFNLLVPNNQYDSSDPSSFEQRREQIQYNPLNQPLFKGGTVPFIGDYIDVASSPNFIPDGNGGWVYDIEAGDSPVFHTVWSDNRDVRGPPDGDWTSYVAPTNDLSSGGLSFFDNSPVEACTPGVSDDRTGMRNQNIYTSRITSGLYVGMPQNAKPLYPLSSGLTTSFVVFIKYANNTLVENADRERAFNITLDLPEGVAASFDQFDFSNEDSISKSVIIGDNSSTAITVFVTSEDVEFASLNVAVESADGELRGAARINPDPTNPLPLVNSESFGSALLKDGDIDTFWQSEIFDGDLVRREDGSFIIQHDLDADDPNLISTGTGLSTNQLDFLNAALLQLSLSNPDVFNPGIYNPGIYNPGIYNPGIYNPGIYNPGIYNPGIYNPGIYNPGIYNPGIYNPGIYNPGIYNGTIVDANYVINNDGEAAAAYNVNLRLDNPDTDNYSYQLIVSKIYTTPIAQGCDIVASPVQEVLVNNNNPELGGNLLGQDSADSFYLEPGEFAIVTLRAIPKKPNLDPDTVFDDASIAVVPDAVDEDLVVVGETEPVPSVVLSEDLKADPLSITTGSLADANGGTFYSAELVATGGSGPRTWSLAPGSILPAGLLLSDSGLISGTPLVGGSFNFTVRVKDSTQITELGLTLDISDPADLVVSSLTHSPTSADSNDLITFTAVVLNQGEESAPASELELRIGDETPSEAIHFTIPILAGGDDYSITRETTLSAQSYLNTATADIHNVVVESNEANNVATESYTVLQELVIAISSPLPDALGGAVYDELLVADGGSGPQAWSLVSGDLPSGLTLSSSGQISGIPEALGVFSFTVRVVDDTQTAEEVFNITITGNPNIFQWSVNGHYYQYVATGSQTWTQANTAAKAQSYLGRPGHLLTITTAAEQAFVNSVRSSMGLNDWRPWIGLDDAAVEGTFTWVTGEAVTYTNWSGGEPSNSNGNEDYVEMFGTGVWNDLPNGAISPFGYIVEFEPAFSSYTTTLSFAPPSPSVTVDRIVWGWSTTSTSGGVSDNSLSEFSMALYNGTTLEYFDHIIGNSDVLPVAGNPGAAIGRPDEDVFWDFSLDTLKLEQFRNILWSTIETTNGTQYLVTDRLNLSSDGIIGFYKYSDGISVGGGTGNLILQSTVKNYP